MAPAIEWLNCKGCHWRHEKQCTAPKLARRGFNPLERCINALLTEDFEYICADAERFDRPRILEVGVGINKCLRQLIKKAPARYRFKWWGCDPRWRGEVDKHKISCKVSCIPISEGYFQYVY